MDRIGIRELRGNVATHVRRAAAGERVLITIGGEPVAMLGPIELDPASGPSLGDLIAAGLLEPARRVDHPDEPEPANLPVDVRTTRVLAEIRGE